MSHPLVKLFHLSSLFHMPNNHRKVDVEFFHNLSCNCKRISFDICSQLVIMNFQWLVTVLLIFSVLVFFAKCLQPPLPCTFVNSSWAKCTVDVASCLCCFVTHFELEYENCSDLLFCLTSFPLSKINKK